MGRTAMSAPPSGDPAMWEVVLQRRPSSAGPPPPYCRVEGGSTAGSGVEIVVRGRGGGSGAGRGGPQSPATGRLVMRGQRGYVQPSAARGGQGPDGRDAPHIFRERHRGAMPWPARLG